MRMGQLRGILLALPGRLAASLLGLAAADEPAPGNEILRGIVKDASGKPVARAKFGRATDAEDSDP